MNDFKRSPATPPVFAMKPSGYAMVADPIGEPIGDQWPAAQSLWM